MSPETRGGGIKLVGSQARIVRCVLRKNFASFAGGAVYLLGPASGEALFVNCSLVENEAAYEGGAVYSLMGRANWVNCIFLDNTAQDAGGALCIPEYDVDSFINCTFVGNSATEGGAIWVQVSDTVEISASNSVVWSNGEDPIHVEQFEGGTFTVTYSDVEVADPNSVYPGTGNINADPLFCDPGNGNLRLQDGSPCIGVGNNSAVPADDANVDDNAGTTTLPWDRGKSTRIYPTSAGVVDMGAFENTRNPECPFDLNSSGAVDIGDLTLFLSCYGQPALGTCAAADFDCDGAVDVGDLAALLAAYGTRGESFTGGPEGEAEFFAWAQQASIEEILAWYAEWLSEQP